MKNFFFIILFLPFIGFSQKSTSVSFKTGINYLYYKYFDDTFTPVEFGRFSRGYCLGITIKKELSTTCFVESGIYYEWKKHNALEYMQSGCLGLLINRFDYL